MALTRIVQREGAVWVIRASPRGRPLTSFKTQQDAVEKARVDLRARGGILHVYKADGELRSTERIPLAPSTDTIQPAIANGEPAAKHSRAARVSTIIAVAGVLLAAVAIPVGMFGPGWAAQLTTPPIENRLSQLHAGDSLSAIESLAGAPTSSTPIDTDTGWTRTVYVRDSHAIAAVTDAEERTVIVAILNCGPHWDATFATPSGTTLQLGKSPLASVEKTQSDVDVNDRTLYYSETMTGQAQATLLEMTNTGPSSGTGWLTYAIGFSSLCGTQPPDGLFTLDRPGYMGLASEAPDDIRDFRAECAPNLYIEVDENASTLAIDEYGWGHLAIEGERTVDVEVAFNATDFRGEFPRNK